MLFLGTKIIAPTITDNCKKTVVSAFQSNTILTPNNDNKNIKLVGEAKIKANKRFFKSIVAANKYIKKFVFKNNCF